MTFSIKTCTYQLPNGHDVDIQFFADAKKFHHVLTDHLLWEEKIKTKGGEPWERPLSRKFLSKLRKEIGSDPVSSIAPSVLTEAYRQVVKVLDEGITFSINFPVYIAFQREQRGNFDGSVYTEGYYFLSWDGIVIVVRNGIVRTAHFRSNTFKSKVSRQELVRQAWEFLKNPRSVIRDTKGGGEYCYVEYKHISAENWLRIDKVLKKWPKTRQKIK